MAVTAVSRTLTPDRLSERQPYPDLVGGSAAAPSHEQPSAFSARVLADRYAYGSGRAGDTRNATSGSMLRRRVARFWQA